jgi:hypothetical protein
MAACGDGLTRENLRYQATRMDRVHVPMLLADITFDTSPTGYSPVEQMQLRRFDGTRWRRHRQRLAGRAGLTSAPTRRVVRWGVCVLCARRRVRQAAMMALRWAGLSALLVATPVVVPPSP